MHTYPAWKIWLVAIVMLAATLLALPNIFGEAPALQLSRNDRAAFTEQGQASVTAILAEKGLSLLIALNLAAGTSANLVLYRTVPPSRS